jgi:hypothetical protein
MADEGGEWFFSARRDVRFEPLFDEQLKGLAVDPQWLDAAISGLDESISRHPEIFPKAPGTNISCARLIVYKDAPALRVFFTYDTTVVRVLSVEFEP